MKARKKAKKAAPKVRVVLPHHRVKVGIAFEPVNLERLDRQAREWGKSRSEAVNVLCRAAFE